ncbi:MAG: hypothetical protein JWO11_3092 [Nocardioides sp.]|nr:hypothetical protein [Nocardioides sp.]
MRARHTTSAVAAVLAAALLVVVLVTWAASIGPSDVLRGDGIAPRRTDPTQPATTYTPSATTPPTDGERLQQRTPDGDANPVVRAIAFFIEIATLVLALYLLWRLLRWARETYDARDRRVPAPDDVDFEVISAPQATDEILADAEPQLALLDVGTPRNAIVAGWHRFEVQALAAGFGRRHWETSSEFTLRFLDLVAADEHAVSVFAELYREARFSDHEIGEPARAAAREALSAIHAGLGAGTSGRPR